MARNRTRSRRQHKPALFGYQPASGTVFLGYERHTLRHAGNRTAPRVRLFPIMMNSVMRRFLRGAPCPIESFESFVVPLSSSSSSSVLLSPI
jgi:hypothetical protein